jgi:nucleoside-triphosphatase
MVFGLALNCLPHLGDTAATVWAAHRVRAGGRWAALVRVPALAEVLLAHTGRIADRAAAAAALRGHATLGGPGQPGLDAPRTVVVTGRRGSGKTPLVAAVVDALVERGVDVAGFLQPAIVEDGRKTGFALRDVATGDEAFLARRVAPGAGRHGTAFEFEPEGFELGVRALGGAPAGAVLVIDELGPVELRGDGHWPAVQRALSRAELRGLVVVVRRTLVPSLVEALGATDVVVVDLDEAGDAAFDRVLDALLPIV